MLRLESPLTEKRIIFFSLRKEMIGRRAYSDSVRLSRKDDTQTAALHKRDYKSEKQDDSASTTSSSSPRSSCSGTSHSSTYYAL
jgi:hypothetical protein